MIINTTLKTQFARIYILINLFVFSVFAELKVETIPLQFGGSHEIGHLQEGLFQESGGKFYTAENQRIHHLSAYFLQQYIIENDWLASVGLGGAWQYRFPQIEGANPVARVSKYRNFYFGPAKVSLQYSKSNHQVELGVFSYKYNPQAYNLGEYLFRSNPYPTVLFTGGYNLIDNTAVSFKGIRYSYNVDNFNLDIILGQHSPYYPLHNLSLAAVTDIHLLDSFINVGFGINFYKFLDLRHSIPKDQAESVKNAYFKRNESYFVADKNYYLNNLNFYTEKFNSLSISDSGSAEWQRIGRLADQFQAIALAFTGISDTSSVFSNNVRIQSLDSGSNWVSLIASGDIELEYYEQNNFTVAGLGFDFNKTILMSRLTLDFKRYINIAFFKPQDLKLYSEVSLLGVRNFPIHYSDPINRLPIMFGFNIPTGFFDVFAVQFEYLKNPYLNNIYNLAALNYSIPYYSNDSLISDNDFLDLGTKDNWKWSVYINKSLGEFMNFKLQVAKDHLFVPDRSFFFGPQLGTNDLTVTEDQWHWEVKLTFNL